MISLAAIKLAIQNLLARKGRSFLTILGIVIGIAGVITIISLGAGAQILILGQVTKLGSNLLIVQPGNSNEKGPPAQVFGITVTTLINSDSDALSDKVQVPYALAINAIVQGNTSVTWRDNTVDTNFNGSDYNYPNVTNFTMREGRFFDQKESQGSANVVVLGSTAADELFGLSSIDPIGQVVKARSLSQNNAGGIPFRVIGVVAPRGSTFFQDNDDRIFIPLLIGQQQLLGIHYLHFINVKVDSSDHIDQTISDIRKVLDRQHRIKSSADEDFTIRNLADAISILKTITNALSVFLTAMASIALIVGGIGILNIMLATVAERTREIGLRKAVGASNRAIMRQFILEAGILTFLGGIFGIIIGVTISYSISLLMDYLGYDWTFIVSIQSVLLAIGVSILTGMIFGLYPALKASKLDPAEALRYE